MKILHVIRDLDTKTGGPVIAVYAIAKMQANAGDEVTILSTAEPGLKLQKIDNVSLVVVPTQFYQWRYSSKFKKLAKFEILKSEIVHVHTMWEYTSYIAQKLCQKIGRPYILRPCGMIDDWSMSQGGKLKKLYSQFIGKKIINNAAGIHFTSLGEMTSSSMFLEKGKGFVLPIPISDGYRKLGVLKKNHRKYILFVGRLHPHKRLEVVFKAFSRLVSNGEIINLVIAGDGSEAYKKKLLELSDELNITPFIVWKGLVDANTLIDLYRNAYFLILMSMHENFGNVLIEAMSQGCPVIISREVQIYKTIVASNAGEVVDACEEKVFFLISRILKDENRRECMSKNSFLLIDNHFKARKIYPKLIKYYEKAIERN